MIREYKGFNQSFKYDDDLFKLAEYNDGPILYYRGSSSIIPVPEGYNSLESMFDSSDLEEINLTLWKGVPLKQIKFAFTNCNKLQNVIGLNGLDVSEVTDFDSIFIGCSALKNVDLSGWNTGNSETFAGMFCDCSSLEHVNVANWDTKNCTDVSIMFNGCTNLKCLDVSEWCTSSLQDMHCFAADCINLETASVEDWDISFVENFFSAFANCFKLKKPDLSKWGISEYAISRLYVPYEEDKMTSSMNIF